MRGPHETARREGVGAALAAAALFGVGTPLAKLFLPGTGVLMLAALLYGGAGLGLVALGVGRRVLGWSRREAPLRRGDLPLLAGVVLSGGVVAPVLLLLGLERLPAADASLLLNLEAPLTVLLAVALFGEHVGGRVLAGTALIVVGAATLDGGTAPDGRWVGMVLVAAACLGWAIDNNLTQRLSLRDPIAIARVKALAAGAINLMLALAAGHALPAARQLAGPLAVGIVSYGISIALAVRAMSLLGAARQAALFAVAPFVGAVASAVLVGDHVDLSAGLVMAAGVALLVREWHEHVHVHEPLEHDHLHVHDEHHQHEHDGVWDEPHAHSHRHVSLTHAHPHVSDVHHRHAHGWR